MEGNHFRRIKLFGKETPFENQPDPSKLRLFFLAGQSIIFVSLCKTKANIIRLNGDS
jgi:hypothetical protein